MGSRTGGDAVRAQGRVNDHETSDCDTVLGCQLNWTEVMRCSRRDSVNFVAIVFLVSVTYKTCHERDHVTNEWLLYENKEQ
jgi:hypothetical protein